MNQDMPNQASQNKSNPQTNREGGSSSSEFYPPISDFFSHLDAFNQNPQQSSGTVNSLGSTVENQSGVSRLVPDTTTPNNAAEGSLNITEPQIESDARFNSAKTYTNEDNRISNLGSQIQLVSNLDTSSANNMGIMDMQENLMTKSTTDFAVNQLSQSGQSFTPLIDDGNNGGQQGLLQDFYGNLGNNFVHGGHDKTRVYSTSAGSAGYRGNTAVATEDVKENSGYQIQNVQRGAPSGLKKEIAQNALEVNEGKARSISELLDIVIKQKASDLHLTAGYPPFIRVDGNLIPVGDVLSGEETKILVSQALSQNHLELLEVNREVDLSYQHSTGDRFRINAFYQKGTVAAAFRLIPGKIRTISELGLPSILLEITRYSQGLFLVTGPTGSGKSTTLAAMVQHINENYPKHVVTIEDPIEYVYPNLKALIDQREVGTDTHDWNIAMRSALRQNPDVILVGELRDFETIQLAITLAETGHLVFATLHTNSASQSIDRIIDVFPSHQQQQIRVQLASMLKGVLSQRLVPLINGGRIAVVELLLITNAVQSLIRENKTFQINNIIDTGADLGMISMERSLVKLVRDGKINLDTALEYAIRPEEVQRLLRSANF